MVMTALAFFKLASGLHTVIVLYKYLHFSHLAKSELQSELVKI